MSPRWWFKKWVCKKKIRNMIEWNWSEFRLLVTYKGKFRQIYEAQASDEFTQKEKEVDRTQE